MRDIPEFDYELMTRSRNYPFALLRAYTNSQVAGNVDPDFRDVIWDYEVGDIVNACHDVGLTHITISTRMPGIQDVIWKFMEYGCRLSGVTQVKAPFKMPGSDDFAVEPAFMIEL